MIKLHNVKRRRKTWYKSFAIEILKRYYRDIPRRQYDPN